MKDFAAFVKHYEDRISEAASIVQALHKGISLFDNSFVFALGHSRIVVHVDIHIIVTDNLADICLFCYEIGEP